MLVYTDPPTGGEVAAGLGFEPRYYAPEAYVLPFDDPAMLSCYLVHEVVAAREAGYYTTPERKFVVVLYNKMSTDKTQRAKLLLRTLLTPSNWTDPAPASLLRVELEKYFSIPVYPLNSGRSALYLLLKAADIGDEDEVLIQAYTCNAVPNPVIWTGAKPVYADVNLDTLNVDPRDLERKITARTKAIILQHTFGRPGPIEQIVDIAKERKILVIEDCAHSLGAEYKGKKLGTFGDAAILSFGREKVVSSLSGGAILVRSEKLIKPLEKLIASLGYASFSSYFREINNFFAWRLFIRKVFFSDFGESLINYLNRKDFFNVVTSSKELVGEKPDWYPKLFPGTFAKIALDELKNLDEVNEKRKKIARYYEKNLKNRQFKLLKPHDGVYLRFVVLHENPELIYLQARKRHFWFGNWYNSPVYPSRVSCEKLYYTAGSCPSAEKAAAQTINLPNYQGMSEGEAEKVADFINQYEV